MIPTGFFLLVSSFLANSLRSLVLYSFFRRISPAQKFNKTSPLAVKTTGASVIFILEPIITKVIWLRNHVGIYYQYKKTSHKERLFCIGESNAMNLELLLSEEYYTETMQTYFNIRKFLDNNHSLANSLPA